MKALVWVANAEMKVENVPEPRPPSGWMVLRVSHTGICGSEVAAYMGLNELRKPPLIMGHEFSGTVESTVEGKEWMAGKTVSVNPLVGCGSCRFCVSGLRNLCAKRKIIGAAFDGSFAELVCVPADSCHVAASPINGALAEPLATAIRAVDRCNLSPSDSAVVFGMGIIGLFILKLLKLRRIGNVVAVDTNAQRLRSADICGATRAVNMLSKDADGDLLDYAGDGFDFSFDAVGIGATRSRCTDLLRSGGKSVFVGNHEDISSIRANTVVRREISIEGSYAYSDHQFENAVHLAQTDFVESDPVWLAVRRLEDGPSTFSALASNSLGQAKIMLKS